MAVQQVAEFEPRVRVLGIIGDHLAVCGDSVIGSAGILEGGSVVGADIGGFRFENESLLVSFDRAVPIFFRSESSSEIVHRVNIVRSQVDGFAISLDGVVGVALGEQDNSHSVVGLRKVGLELESFPIGGERFVKLAFVEECEAQIAFGDRVGGL